MTIYCVTIVWYDSEGEESGQVLKTFYDPEDAEDYAEALRDDMADELDAIDGTIEVNECRVKSNP